MGGEPGSGSRGAGADAFGDLLAEIATFTEMQRVALVGFLRKRAVCDVFAVARFTVFEAHDSSGFGVRLFDSELRDERRLFVDRGKDEESGRSGGTETSDKPRAPRYEGVVRLGNRRADAGERFGGSGTFDRDGRGPGGRVFKGHVGGDDVTIKVGVNAFAHFRLGIEKQVILAAQYVRVLL